MFLLRRNSQFGSFDRNLTAIKRLFESLTQPSEGPSLNVGRNVRVSVHRVGYLRVPEYFLDDLRVLPLFEHSRGEGVPEIVEADSLRQSSLLEERFEVAGGGGLRAASILAHVVKRGTLAWPLDKRHLCLRRSGQAKPGASRFELLHTS